MFERDKDDLRDLGVPLDTRQTPGLDADYGYVIDRSRYELPDVALDREEVAALAVALEMTDPGVARMGLTKLAARAPDPLDRDAPVPARVSLTAEAVDDVADALLARRPVTFGYRTADGSRSTRTVDPYAVATRRGSWYLVGRDHDRDAIRAFRLDRTTSAIKATGEEGSFEIPEDLDLEAAISGPADQGIEAVVSVSEVARLDAERRGGVATGEEHDGRTLYRFEQASPWQLRSWLLGSGPEAELIEPAWLRAEIVEAFESMASA